MSLKEIVIVLSKKTSSNNVSFSNSKESVDESISDSEDFSDIGLQKHSIENNKDDSFWNDNSKLNLLERRKEMHQDITFMKKYLNIDMSKIHNLSKDDEFAAISNPFKKIETQFNPKV